MADHSSQAPHFSCKAASTPAQPIHEIDSTSPTCHDTTREDAPPPCVQRSKGPFEALPDEIVVMIVTEVVLQDVEDAASRNAEPTSYRRPRVNSLYLGRVNKLLHEETTKQYWDRAKFVFGQHSRNDTYYWIFKGQSFSHGKLPNRDVIQHMDFCTTETERIKLLHGHVTRHMLKSEFDLSMLPALRTVTLRPPSLGGTPVGGNFDWSSTLRWFWHGKANLESHIETIVKVFQDLVMRAPNLKSIAIRRDWTGLTRSAIILDEHWECAGGTFDTFKNLKAIANFDLALECLAAVLIQNRHRLPLRSLEASKSALLQQLRVQ